jgi:hypothetical protein
MAGFTIPNAPDTDKSTLDQSEPDRVDFEILGNRRKGVVANAGVTSVSGTIVAVAAGTIAYEGTDYALSANGSYTLSGAPSSGNRFDLVVARFASAAVTIQTVAGVASSTNPVFPALPATDVVLAAVLRRANEAIESNDIIDKRAFCLASPGTTIDWSNVTSKPDPVITLGGDLSGSVTLTDLTSGTLTATIAANSVALGTDTTGNYVESLVAGTSITLTNNSGESATPTIAVNVNFGDSDQIVLGAAIFS